MQETDLQDESIRELASTLREMFGTANVIKYMPEIPNTTSVIEEIGRQSLQVASLIHEYTKLPWAGNYVPLLGSANSNNVAFVVRTVEIPGKFVTRNCVYLLRWKGFTERTTTSRQVHPVSHFTVLLPARRYTH
jgi:hypothetical protein